MFFHYFDKFLWQQLCILSKFVWTEMYAKVLIDMLIIPMCGYSHDRTCKMYEKSIQTYEKSNIFLLEKRNAGEMSGYTFFSLSKLPISYRFDLHCFYQNRIKNKLNRLVLMSCKTNRNFDWFREFSHKSSTCFVLDESVFGICVNT